MIVRSAPARRITPKEAEALKPTIHEIVGIYKAMMEVKNRVEHLTPEAEANFLLVGEQGTGPSATLQALIRHQLRDPSFGTGDNFEFSAKIGQSFLGIRLGGASIAKAQLENQVQLAIHGWGCRHVLVLLSRVAAR